jgi:hypothetical protein
VSENDKLADGKTPTLSQTIFQGQKSPKKRKKVQVLEQWVEVRIEEGRTVTTLYPSNQTLLDRGKAMWPAPELVYRRFNFPDGVPDEYSWVGITENRKRLGGCGIQRMTVDTWLEMMDTEDEEIHRVGYQSSTVPKHVGPTGTGNLPRPKDRGECECPVCQRNQAILDADSPDT